MTLARLLPELRLQPESDDTAPLEIQERTQEDPNRVCTLGEPSATILGTVVLLMHTVWERRTGQRVKLFLTRDGIQMDVRKRAGERLEKPMSAWQLDSRNRPNEWSASIPTTACAEFRHRPLQTKSSFTTYKNWLSSLLLWFSYL